MMRAFGSNDVQRIFYRLMALCLFWWSGVGACVAQEKLPNTPVNRLYQAVNDLNVTAVEALLAKGVDPNAPNTAKVPPLVAVMALRFLDEKKLKIVRLLLQHGADPNGVDPMNMTPLMWLASDREEDDFLDDWYAPGPSQQWLFAALVFRLRVVGNTLEMTLVRKTDGGDSLTRDSKMPFLSKSAAGDLFRRSLDDGNGRRLCAGTFGCLAQSQTGSQTTLAGYALDRDDCSVHRGQAERQQTFETVPTETTAGIGRNLPVAVPTDGDSLSTGALCCDAEASACAECCALSSGEEQRCHSG